MLNLVAAAEYDDEKDYDYEVGGDVVDNVDTCRWQCLCGRVCLHESSCRARPRGSKRFQVAADII